MSAQPNPDLVSRVELAPWARAEAQRILDGAARRLLAEQVDRDSLGAAPEGGDDGGLDGGADERPPLVESQEFPVR